MIEEPSPVGFLWALPLVEGRMRALPTGSGGCHVDESAKRTASGVSDSPYDLGRLERHL